MLERLLGVPRECTTLLIIVGRLIVSSMLNGRQVGRRHGPRQIGVLLMPLGVIGGGRL